MVNVKLNATYQGYSQEVIRKGDNAGNTYYVVKLLLGFDTLEFRYYDNDANLIQKFLKIEPFSKVDATIGITQNSGNTKLNILDITQVK